MIEDLEQQKEKGKEDGSTDGVDSDTIAITRVEVIGKDGREFSRWLDGSTYKVSIQDDGRTIKLLEEKIKPNWYEDEANFPALLKSKNGSLFLETYPLNAGTIILIENGKLEFAKEERDSLYIGE